MHRNPDPPPVEARQLSQPHRLGGHLHGSRSPPGEAVAIDATASPARQTATADRAGPPLPLDSQPISIERLLAEQSAPLRHSLRYSCCSYPTDTGNRLRFAGADTPRGAYGRLVLVYGVPVPSRNPALRARVPLIAPALCSASYAFDGLICHSGAWGEDDGLAVSGLGLPVPPHLLEDYPEEVMRRSLARVETDGPGGRRPQPPRTASSASSARGLSQAQDARRRHQGRGGWLRARWRPQPPGAGRRLAVRLDSPNTGTSGGLGR